MPTKTAKKRVSPDPVFKITRKLTESGDRWDRSREYDLFLNGEPCGTVSEYTTTVAPKGCRYRTSKKSRTGMVYLNEGMASRATGASIAELCRHIGRYFTNPTGPRLTEALRQAIAATRKDK